MFTADGRDKASAVMSHLWKVPDLDPENYQNFVFLSVGGADGGEAAYFLTNTTCEHAVLLEYSEVAVKAAKTKDYYLHKLCGKRIYSI
jgi:hypothetical protein